MKRLTAQIGITYFFVLSVVFFLQKTVVFWLGVSLAAAALLLFLSKKIHHRVYLPAMALTAALACAVNLGYTRLFVTPVTERYAGETCAIEAVIDGEPYRYYNENYYRLKTVAVNGEKARILLLVRTKQSIKADPYDTVIFDAAMDMVPEAYRNYYYAKGYYLSVPEFPQDYTVMPQERKPLMAYVLAVRKSFRDVLEYFLPPNEAALCRAVFIGDKYALNADAKEDFRYAGASHFVVVSGMHFAILTTACLWLLQKLLRSRRIALILTGAAALVYMAVTGFSPSVVRSGIMLLIVLFGSLIRRDVYPLASLGAAGVICTFVFTPYGPGDIGLLLSFSATFAILLWADPVYETIRVKKTPKKRPAQWFVKLVNAFLRLLSASLAANILAVPISVLMFHGFSVVTLLSAVALYPEFWLILVLSMMVCLLFYIPGVNVLALLLSWPLYFLCRFVLWLVSAIASLPFSYLKVYDWYVFLWMGLTAILFLSAYVLAKRGKPLRYAALCSLLMLLAGVLSGTVMTVDDVILRVFQTDGGNVVALQTADVTVVLDADASPSNVYAAMRRLAESTRVAEAVCSSQKEERLLGSISNREFAFSGFLEYDIRERAETEEAADDTTTGETAAEEALSGIRLFHSEAVLTVSDGIMDDIGTTKNGLYQYLVCGSVSVLLLENGVDAADIPEPYRTADVVVFEDLRSDYDLLSGETLIVTARKPLALISASELKDHFDQFRFSFAGDIAIDLSRLEG